jgi:histone deacetylase 6
MKKIPTMNDAQLSKLEYSYNSVYFNKHSYASALLSAGGVVELCDEIVQGKLANGIAIVRPPGHHAESNCAMGFCLFNNVAIAAKAMIDKHNLSRIVILDWDVHHGNATQHMFESDPRVLYISIHRYDDVNFYPNSRDADPKKIGLADGMGKNVNIAWNTNRKNIIGDTEYWYAYQSLIKPMLTEYDPELVIVSAGFDCAHGDPLGGLHVTPSCFFHMTSDLMSYASGKVAIILEGGYNLSAISQSMLACTKALLKKDTMQLILNDVISNVAINAVNQTKAAQKLYWKFLQ